MIGDETAGVGPPGARAKEFFDGLWEQGDPWSLETATYDQQKDDRQLALISDRRYVRALEVGCGAGTFSRKLSTMTDALVAIDVSEVAIAAATERNPSLGNVRFQTGNVMDLDLTADGPWDLVVISETIYYLGWLYPFFDVAWLAHQVSAATRPGGRLLLTNTCGGSKNYLHQQWILRTYQDLFVNVGYQIEQHEVFRGSKNGVELEAVMAVFLKPTTLAPDSPGGEGLR